MPRAPCKPTGTKNDQGYVCSDGNVSRYLLFTDLSWFDQINLTPEAFLTPKMPAPVTPPAESDVVVSRSLKLTNEINGTIYLGKGYQVFYLLTAVMLVRN